VWKIDELGLQSRFTPRLGSAFQGHVLGSDSEMEKAELRQVL